MNSHSSLALWRWPWWWRVTTCHSHVQQWSSQWYWSLSHTHFPSDISSARCSEQLQCVFSLNVTDQISYPYKIWTFRKTSWCLMWRHTPSGCLLAASVYYTNRLCIWESRVLNWARFPYVTIFTVFQSVHVYVEEPHQDRFRPRPFHTTFK
jgi:hypothetical protein